jgi:hypothetical protein
LAGNLQGLLGERLGETLANPVRMRDDGMKKDDLGVTNEVLLLSFCDALLKSFESLYRLCLVVICIKTKDYNTSTRISIKVSKNVGSNKLKLESGGEMRGIQFNVTYLAQPARQRPFDHRHSGEWFGRWPRKQGRESWEHQPQSRAS